MLRRVPRGRPPDGPAQELLHRGVVVRDVVREGARDDVIQRVPASHHRTPKLGLTAPLSLGCKEG